MQSDTFRGTLFLVVGPSGAGKDSLIAGARAALGMEDGYLFAGRVITRPADAGGEAHEAVTPETFEALRRAGAFALHWRAHDLCYGIRREIAKARAVEIAVVANVSRAVIDQARRELAPVRVLNVTAPPTVLAARLAQRGRESAAAVEARLARAVPAPKGDDVVEILNDGTLEQGVARFLAALRA